MVLNVLEEQPRSLFTGHLELESVCPDQNLGALQSDYTVLIFCIYHAWYHYHI